MKALRKKSIRIYIEPGQNNLLETLSRKRGVSKAAIVRDGLEKYFNELPLEDDPVMGLIGLGSSGKVDLAEKHDQYLAEYTKSIKG